MSAKFTKFTANDTVKNWSHYFHSGTDWLMTWQLLEDLRRSPGNEAYVPAPFYVDTHIIHFCLELFTKSLIAYSDHKFNPKTHGHDTFLNIEKYHQLSPIFAKIINEPQLKSLVKEFANTIDTRYGETYVVIEDGDVDKMMALVCAMRDEMCQKTGLH